MAAAAINLEGSGLPPFEIVDHTADWAVRVRGSNFSQLLIHAAQAMNSLLVMDPNQLSGSVTKQVFLEEYDRESLLVAWLNELAFWAEMEGVIFNDFDLSQVTNRTLTGTVRGGVAPELQKHIKAVTYHNLVIQETAQGLETVIVFDV